MAYTIDDITKKDADTIGKWASDPRFFYVYINSGISENEPEKAAKSGVKYAEGCDQALQGRKSNLKLSEFEGSLPSRLVDKGVSELFNQAVKLTTPWDNVWTKGLRDENDKLCGLTVLMHEKKTGKTEIGYMLDPDYHGKGLATSMVMSTLDWARDNTNLKILKADVDPSNGASCGILKKLGMVPTEYKEIGPYKNRDGSPIPSQIMEASGDKVDEAIQAYVAKGGELYHVSDAVLDVKKARAMSLGHDDAGHDSTLG